MEHLSDIDIINISLGGVILSLSVILLMTPIPLTKRWTSFRTGRTTLAIAYIILSGLMFINGLVEADNSGMSGMITLIVSFYQALLYTRTCILFLRPQSYAGNRYKTLLIALTTFSCILVLSYMVAPAIFNWTFYIGLVLYALLMVICAVDFIRIYNKTLRRLEDVYDEDMHYRVRWVKRCFYSALLIGIMAWFMTVFHSCVTLNVLCMFVYTVYYLVVVGYFVRYTNNCGFIVRSDELDSTELLHEVTCDNVEAGAQSRAVESNPVTIGGDQLAERLEEWVKQKKYHDSNKTLNDIVLELNTTRDCLSEYTINHYGVNFRTWRNRLRIDEAMQLLAESDIPVADIYFAVGYSDRSNFHRQFTEITGVTPTQYRKKMRDDATASSQH